MTTLARKCASDHPVCSMELSPCDKHVCPPKKFCKRLSFWIWRRLQGFSGVAAAKGVFLGGEPLAGCVNVMFAHWLRELLLMCSASSLRTVPEEVLFWHTSCYRHYSLTGPAGYWNWKNTNFPTELCGTSSLASRIGQDSCSLGWDAMSLGLCVPSLMKVHRDLMTWKGWEPFTHRHSTTLQKIWMLNNTFVEISNLTFRVGLLCLIMKCFLVFLKDLSLGPCCLMYLLMTNTVLLRNWMIYLLMVSNFFVSNDL